MKLLIVCSVVLFITTHSWAYSKNCAQGPNYWCRDLSTAKECNTVQYCQQNIWLNGNSNKKPSTVVPTADMLCNAVVQAAEELFTNDFNDVNVMKQYLRDDCTKLQDNDNLIHKCQMAVDLYVPDILKHFQSGTESTKICSIIQGHDSQTVPIQKPIPAGLTPNQTCILCEFIMRLVQTMATSNSSAQELAKILEDICDAMPSVLKDECKSFIDQYGIDIVALLLREFDPDKTCQLLKLCPKPKDVSFLMKPNPNICGLCDYISTYISAGYSQQNVCNYFTTDRNIREQCEILVQLHKPKLCSQLPICFKDVVIQPIYETTGTTIQSAQCSLCKYIIGYIDNIIQNNKSEAAIEAALEKVCTILPAALKPKCDQFVQTYGPVIVQLLIKYGTPELVCDALKLCHNGTESLTPLERVQIMKNKKTSLKSVQCFFCKTLIGFLYSAIGNNRTPEAIEAALEKVCNVFPASLKNNCTALVNKYGPIIAFMLGRNATAEQVCDFIKICNNGTQQIDFDSLINSAQCALCKYIISYVDTIIQNNKSEAAIEAALEKVCTILPAALKSKCDQFVQTYGPVLFQLIQKYGTPDLVCDALKLCNNGTMSQRPIISSLISDAGKRSKRSSEVQSMISSAQCSLCKYIISYIDAAIGSNKTEAAIEAALEKVCTILPGPLKDKCDQFIVTYGPVLFQLIQKYGTPELVCDALKLCHNGTAETTLSSLVLSMNQPSSIKAAQCSLCKYVISYIDAAIGSNKTEAAIEAALEKVCTILPGPLKDKCDQFIVTYGPVLFQLIQKYGTPELVCDALKLCHNGTAETTLSSLVLSMNQPSSIKAAQCSLCKYVISYIDAAIGSNKTEAAIEAALEKVCTILPGPLKDKCDQFIVTYGPVLFQLIQKYGTPELVCDALKLCHNGTAETTLSSLVLSMNQPSSIKAAQCSLCKYVISYIDAAIGSNKTEAAIEAALEKVCTILPGPLKDKCDQFIVTYGPVLFQLIQKYGTPELVCDALKLCHNGTAETTLSSLVLSMNQPSSIKAAQCSLCKYVISYIDAAIGSNKTEAAIEAALEKVCTILPGPLKDKCDQFIVTYGPVLFQLIQKYGTPELVCDALKLCHNGTAETTLSSLVLSMNQPSSIKAAQCSLCKYVISYIDAAIGSNKTEAAIEAALEKVCTILPGPLKDKCDQFIVTYGPVLFQLIQKYGTPELVCDALKLCHNGTETVASVIGNIAGSIQHMKDSAECVLCKYIISYLNVLIDSNATAEEMEKALELVCTILPAAYHAKCKSFVDTYAPILTELIAELDDPNVVCEWLTLCPKSGKKVIDIPAVKLNKLKSLPCNLCQYIVNYLDAIIKSNSTETDFEDALDKACAILPVPKLQSECRLLVQMYTPDLVKLLVELGDPKKVCQAIGICDK